MVLLTGRLELERLERLSSISTSELVAELTVDTETLPLQSLISDFLNQRNVKTRRDSTMQDNVRCHLTGPLLSHQLVENNELQVSYLRGGGGVIRGAGQVWTP